MRRVPYGLRLVPLALMVLTGALAVGRLCCAQDSDRLSQILAGDAFQRLGDHGQAVALYLAATKAPTWDEARPLLERIWRQYPHTTAVDVAYAFAGRHYRDAGNTQQAIRYFEKALEAARQRGRPWTGVLTGELDRLRPRYAQAPPAPVPQAPVTPRTIEIPADSEIGRWQTRDEPDSAVNTRPDGIVEVSTQAPTPDPFTPAWFLVAQDLTVTGVSLRVKIEPSVDYQVQFGDRDGTSVAANSRDFGVDADGWRRIEADFANLRSVGTGNFVMERLSGLGVVITRRLEPGTRLQVLIGDMVFKVGEPVPTADAPPGQAALQLRPTTTDGSGATWLPYGVTVAADGPATDDGQPSIRVSVVIDQIEDKGSGGHVAIAPPEERPWLGDRLVFQCFPQDTAFLPVIINDKHGVQLSKRLDADDLAVGQWNRVEIPFAEANRSDTTERDSLGEVASVLLVPHTSWDVNREHIKAPGEYAWYVADMHVEGEGPTPLPPRTAQTPAAGTTDDSGASWFAYEALSVIADAETVHDGRTSMRLSAVIEDLAREGPSGHACLIPPPDAPWLGDRLVFWCLPRDVPFLPVIVNSRNRVQLSTVVGPEDLVVGEWNRVEIPFEDAYQTATTLAEEFGEIASVLFVPHTGWDRQHEHIKQPGEYVWYIDDVHVEGEGPVSLEQRVEPIADLGLEMKWSLRGNCTIERETEVADTGDGSARLTVELEDTEGSGGSAIARPPDGRPWPATEITFSCLAATTPLLTVFAQDSDGTSVSWLLTDELQMGEWSLVTLSPGQCANVGSGDDVMNDITLLAFGCRRGRLSAHSVLPPVGPVTWYLDSFEIANDQPVPVKPHPARAQAGQALRDDTGDPVAWRVLGRGQVEQELVIVREGASSLKLTVLPEAPGLGRQAVGEGRVLQPRRTGGVSFWLWPTAAGPLTLTATDTGRQVALWTIPAEELVARDWNEIRLSLADARLVDGKRTPRAISPDQFGRVSTLRFALSASAGSPQERRTWYIDSLRLSGGDEES